MAKRHCVSCDKRLKKKDTNHEVWVRTAEGKAVTWLCDGCVEKFEKMMVEQELERANREDDDPVYAP